MALHPKAVQKLIKPGPTDPRVDVMVGTVGHVAVSMADSLYGWFNGPSGGVESHFYIRLTGVVEQYRDTAYEADAQGGGNSWLVGGKRYGLISYETEGMGAGEWTPAQLASIKELILWGESVHHYPMVKATSPHGPGHGYHSLFIEWNKDKHACPGADRIKQFNNDIVPWLARRTPTDGFLMALTDAEQDRILRAADRAFALMPRDTHPTTGERLRLLDTGDGGVLRADIASGSDAAAIAAAIPANLAQQVVVELGKILNPPKETP